MMIQQKNAILLARVSAVSLVSESQVWNFVNHRQSWIASIIQSFLPIFLLVSGYCYSGNCCDYIKVCGRYAERGKSRTGGDLPHHDYLAWLYLGIPIDSFKIQNLPNSGPTQAIPESRYLVDDSNYVNRWFEIGCNSNLEIRIQYHLADTISRGITHIKSNYKAINNGVAIFSENKNGSVFDKVPNYGFMRSTIEISKNQNILTCKVSDFVISLLFYAIPWTSSNSKSENYQLIR